MTSEKEFERAKEIQEYIMLLEKEIMDLMDFLPPVKVKKEKTPWNWVKTDLGGWIMKIFKREDQKMILDAKTGGSHYPKEQEFEITNADIMALVKVRSDKQHELIEEFKQLTGIELDPEAEYDKENQ